MANNQEPCDLYLITPEKIDDLDAFSATLDDVLATGHVACVQLRLKGANDETILKTADRLLDVCHGREVSMLLNDRADLADEVDADGVHIGQDDISYAEAREILGNDKDIGVTCHNSRHLGFEAAEAGASYVAFGAFFSSVTKPEAELAEFEPLTMWDEATDIPCVAIGGITPENCRSVADAGAHFIAVCSGVWNHSEGPVTAVKEYYKALT